MPWVVEADGYTTKINGQLLHLEATTSLQYRSLVESETLEFAVKCHYPLRWNDHQEWIFNFTGCKASVNLIYAHKGFFQGKLFCSFQLLSEDETLFPSINIAEGQLITLLKLPLRQPPVSQFLFEAI